MQIRPIAYAPQRARATVATIHPLWMACPWSERLNDYDRRNIGVFAQLLH